MDQDWSKNIGLIIPILSFLVAILVNGSKIWETIQVVRKEFNNPLVFVKVLVVAASGFFVATSYFIIIDYLTNSNLSSGVVLEDVRSGAGWGISIALFTGFFAKSPNEATVLGIVAGFIALFISGPHRFINPNELMGFEEKQMAAMVLSWVATSLGLTAGFAGYKTKAYLDRALPKE